MLMILPEGLLSLSVAPCAGLLLSFTSASANDPMITSRISTAPITETALLLGRLSQKPEGTGGYVALFLRLLPCTAGMGAETCGMGPE